MHIKQITLKNVTKNFSHPSGYFSVLNEINAVFLKGKTYAIKGVSGSGKSTLLHLISGLDEPSSGNIFINNDKLSYFTAEKKDDLKNQNFGLIFQNPYLIEELTVLENIMLKGLINGTSKAACLQKAHEIISWVGLESKKVAYTHQLSGGQQQKVAIGRALFYNPDFLIADEPTNHLDTTAKNQIIELFLRCNAQLGMGIILTSHDEYVAHTMHEQFVLKSGTLTHENNITNKESYSAQKINYSQNSSSR